MKLRTLISLLISLFLAGCVSIALKRQEAAMKEGEKIKQECEQRRVQGLLKTYVESAQCSNDKMRRVIQESGFPHMDIIDLLLASRLALSQRVDGGQLTEAEANLLLAELGIRLNSEIRYRNLAAYQAESARLAATGALLQGIGVWGQSLQPAPPPSLLVPLRR